MQAMKKPIAVDVIQYTVDNFNLLREFVGNKTALHRIGDNNLMIETPEGMMKVLVGSWIVRGVEGEFYAVKNSIFEKTYEKIAPQENKDEKQASA